MSASNSSSLNGMDIALGNTLAALKALLRERFKQAWLILLKELISLDQLPGSEVLADCPLK